MVRTITEKARTMISGASLDKVFWGEAVLTATYLINLTPTKALKVLTHHLKSDLSPLNFCLWGHVKEITYAESSENFYG
ncbi:Copia protein [Habropoda laboriosa]|uniref:Copia protein n=1 Tax=Habropoda laboriosa TaxID=597456 RepID=A0A0L7QYC2_9HYME|nr:Copia protein [Habropoda laboriosa]